jgi:hypothetical protein
MSNALPIAGIPFVLGLRQRDGRDRVRTRAGERCSRCRNRSVGHGRTA